MNTKAQQASRSEGHLTLLKVSDVAKRLSVSASKVYELVEGRRISHHRIGGAIRISEEQLAQFLNETLEERGPKERAVRQLTRPNLRHLKL